MDEPRIYLNGRFLPESSAGISLSDAGLVQGTTVAEQLRTFGGNLFHLRDHLARLEHSLDIVGVNPGLGWEQLAELALELVEHNHRLLAAGDDLGLSIFITPGEYPAYSTQSRTEPTVCLHTYPLPFRLWAGKYRSGQVLRTTEIRQVPPECWPPELKCRSRMHYYLADRLAGMAEPGARALMLDHEGWVTEASTANILLYRPEEGFVSPPASKVLQGISLAMTCELAGQLGISTAHRDLTVAEVASADEVLLTSTPLCLLPVSRLNGHPIGRGRPGELFGRLADAWSDSVGVDIVAQAEKFAQRR
ncbi:MAG: aminotransferase class IV [Pirellulales bacterium]|nr:aminotransferase class IV [Pirellulales bacterium]